MIGKCRNVFRKLECAMSVCVLVAFVYNLLADLTWMRTSWHSVIQADVHRKCSCRHKEKSKRWILSICRKFWSKYCAVNTNSRQAEICIKLVMMVVIFLLSREISQMNLVTNSLIKQPGVIFKLYYINMFTRDKLVPCRNFQKDMYGCVIYPECLLSLLLAYWKLSHTFSFDVHWFQQPDIDTTKCCHSYRVVPNSFTKSKDVSRFWCD